MLCDLKSIRFWFDTFHYFTINSLNKSSHSINCWLVQALLLLKYLLKSHNISWTISFSSSSACLYCSTDFGFFYNSFTHSSLCSLLFSHNTECYQCPSNPHTGKTTIALHLPISLVLFPQWFNPVAQFIMKTCCFYHYGHFFI